MKTDYEKNADWQDQKLLKLIDPYCYDFKDVGGLMRNCLMQHDIIHALLNILKNRFNCRVEVNQMYDSDRKRYVVENLSFNVEIPREEREFNKYMLREYDDPLKLVSEKKK